VFQEVHHIPYNHRPAENASAMKRAIIFDFGGVFMKTLDYRPRHRWDARLELPPGSVERIVHGSESWRQAQRGEISPEAYWDDVSQQLKLSSDDLRQLIVDFFNGDRLDTDLVAYARQLRADGHPIALLSNDSPALAGKLQALGIANLFDPLVISALIGVMKPDPRAYQAVLNALERAPAEAVFIDDLPANVEGARALGIPALHYTTTPALQAELPSLLET
jgi:putative hydrolase of the HAD superfamily